MFGGLFGGGLDTSSSASGGTNYGAPVSTGGVTVPGGNGAVPANLILAGAGVLALFLFLRRR